MIGSLGIGLPGGRACRILAGQTIPLGHRLFLCIGHMDKELVIVCERLFHLPVEAQL